METDQVLDAIKKLDARRLHEEPDEENIMEHPEEIYKDINGKEMSESERLWGDGMNRRRAYDLGHEAGYAKCLADTADPLEGYSNLTEAISAGEPIDYEKLEGRFAKCVHPELPNPFPIGNLQVHNESELRTPTGWREPIDSFGTVRRYALMHSWWGDYDWTLWVEGDIPMRRKTADQLPVTTFFKGRRVGTNGAGSFMRVGESKNGKFILSAINFLPSPVSAEEWEVLEEYGTFQKPEGK